MRFQSGVFIVTGGSSGIGRAIVNRLHEEQLDVISIDITPSDQSLTTPHFIVDVTNEQHLKNFSDKLKKPIAGLVHAAGIQLTGDIATMNIEDMQRLLEINVLGSFLVAKHVGTKIQDGGSAVFVASELAFIGTSESPVYSATKGAIVAFVRSLAVSWKNRKIRVNALCPGATDTPLLQRIWNESPSPEKARRADEELILLNRCAQPDEIASTAIFMLSEEASFVNGHSLIADGGTVIW
ncbi:SDR family NAD(P)-dependent oxidoreductase [Sulfoacidibacillus ferrooxidans]|uniref:Dihydroanticapsin 7-dehydrogenase n=1 Tax=Sulfoacidibacillus ferrooxidans TaxID=2005001 RepID=A0A9X2AFP1_9BACL|nr:SDR family oxidoreductase [Sulfoacidibacillus ferrooxidans]MCI0184226.1 Dihydroanticapsin 7-dehydrogenase [Sulfoacidibacillus ferrooxidans]